MSYMYTDQNILVETLWSHAHLSPLTYSHSHSHTRSIPQLPKGILIFYFFFMFVFNPCPATQILVYTAFANCVDPDQLASQKPNYLALDCLSLSIQIWFNSLNQVIWLAENLKWVWYLNLFSRRRVNFGKQGPVVQSIISLMSSLVVKNVNCSSKYNI